MEAKERLIVALDVNSVDKAANLVKMLSPRVGSFKIGLEFINSLLADILSLEYEKGFRTFIKSHELFKHLNGKIFWDGKFHDIPNTVGGASKEAAKLRVKMFNLHASATKAAMKAAVEKKGDALVLAVTVLTSISEADCRHIYGAGNLKQVLMLATDAAEAGVDGVICSPLELPAINSGEKTRNLIKVTPGIRPKWAVKKDDQARVTTPYDAVKSGADYIVVGRPIINPPEEIGGPVKAAELIVEEIEQALAE